MPRFCDGDARTSARSTRPPKLSFGGREVNEQLSCFVGLRRGECCGLRTKERHREVPGLAGTRPREQFTSTWLSALLELTGSAADRPARRARVSRAVPARRATSNTRRERHRRPSSALHRIIKCWMGPFGPSARSSSLGRIQRVHAHELGKSGRARRRLWVSRRRSRMMRRAGLVRLTPTRLPWRAGGHIAVEPFVVRGCSWTERLAADHSDLRSF